MKTILIYSLPRWESSGETVNLLAAIKKLGYRSVLFSDRETSEMLLADRAEVNAAWSYDFLLEVAQEEKVDLALLAIDFASPLIGRLNRELGLPGPSDSAYHSLSDKLEWSLLAKKNNIGMPQEWLVTDESQFLSANSDRPVIIKPTKSTGVVSDRTYGYKYFDSIEHFYFYLRENDLLDDFLQINQKSSRFGKYIIQEKLDYVFWGNLGITIIGDNVYFNEIHQRFFHAFPNQTFQCSSSGPMKLEDRYRAHAEKIVDVVRSLGFKNSGLNIDIIETPDGQLYTIDVNVRFGSTWTSLLSLRKSTYMAEAIQGFLGLPYHLPDMTGAYLRRKLELKPGKIAAIRVPEIFAEGVKLIGKNHLRPGTVVPEVTGRHTWPVEFLISADSHDQCESLFNEAKNRIECTYEL